MWQVMSFPAVLTCSRPLRRGRFMFCNSGGRSRIHDLFCCPVSSWRAETSSNSASCLCIVGAQWGFGEELSYKPCKMLQVPIPQWSHSVLYACSDLVNSSYFQCWAAERKNISILDTSGVWLSLLIWGRETQRGKEYVCIILLSLYQAFSIQSPGLGNVHIVTIPCDIFQWNRRWGVILSNSSRILNFPNKRNQMSFGVALHQGVSNHK